MLRTIGSNVVPGLDQRRIAHEQRNADRLLVGQPSLDAQAVLAVEVAVIAGEDDQRVVELLPSPRAPRRSGRRLPRPPCNIRSRLRIVSSLRAGGRAERRQVADLSHAGPACRRGGRRGSSAGAECFASAYSFLCRSAGTKCRRVRIGELPSARCSRFGMDRLVRQIEHERPVVRPLEELDRPLVEDDRSRSPWPCATLPSIVQLGIDVLALPLEARPSDRSPAAANRRCPCATCR